MRYFMYCRKSSEDDDRQVLSIESQKKELEGSLERLEGIEIISIFEESFSAKAPGRSVFNDMMRRLEKGEADGIVAWHPDRLARNSVDGGRIIHSLDTGVIKDLKFSTFSFENNSQGKFMLSIIFGYSKYYVDNLSENVKRGNRARIARGWCTSFAPLGYLNDKATKTIVSDPDRFHLVQQMFKEMLIGCQSPKQIHSMARDDWNLRTRITKRMGGKPVVLSGIYKILSNPFYAGLILHAGKEYPGKHPPMITITEFESIQEKLGKKGRSRPIKLYFPYRGLISCGQCGGAVTAENKTNRFGSRYEYYHCSYSTRPKCPQKSIEAKELERQVMAYLKDITTQKDSHDKLIFSARQQFEQDNASSVFEKKQAEAQLALDRVSKQKRNLLQLRVNDDISEAEFEEHAIKLQRDEIHCQRQLSEVTSEQSIEPFESFISFSHRAIHWFVNAKPINKRLIVQATTSNLTLKDKKLRFEARKPFQYFVREPRISYMCGLIEDVRTLLDKEESKEMMDLIRKLNERFAVED